METEASAAMAKMANPLFLNIVVCVINFVLCGGRSVLVFGFDGLMILLGESYLLEEIRNLIDAESSATRDRALLAYCLFLLVYCTPWKNAKDSGHRRCQPITWWDCL